MCSGAIFICIWSSSGLGQPFASWKHLVSMTTCLGHSQGVDRYVHCLSSWKENDKTHQFNYGSFYSLSWFDVLCLNCAFTSYITGALIGISYQEYLKILIFFMKIKTSLLDRKSWLWTRSVTTCHNGDYTHSYLQMSGETEPKSRTVSSQIQSLFILLTRKDPFRSTCCSVGA